MIRHLYHHEIDKVKWDLCVTQSVNSLIYAYSWYLDIASPGWDALVMDDYQAVFPLTKRKKIVRYLYQPFFTQQLGLFYINPKTESWINDFIDAIPSYYKYIDIQLNEFNHPNEKKFKLKKRKNYLLDLNLEVERLRANFSSHTARNVRKSEKAKLILEDIESDAAVEFYIRNKADVTARVEKEDYLRLKKLLNTAHYHRMLICRGVYSQEKELLATAAVYFTPGRLYMINNCVSPKGKELRAMYFLVNDIITTFAGQKLLLDFEGSDREGIAQFNKSFGAEKHTYPRLIINKLPFILRYLKG